MSTRRPTNDPLGAWLRSGDPAANDGEPRPDEVARWRRRTLAAATAPRRTLWWSLAAAAAVLAVALLLPPREAAPPGQLAGPASAPVAETASEARQIRFATAEGTQIIWVLDPNLNL